MIRARLLIAAVFGLFAPLIAVAQVIPFFGHLPMVPFYGTGTPAFVASLCPGLPANGQCVDFVGNQWWDGLTSNISTATAAFTDTRSVAAPYDPGTSITTSVAINTLPIGSAGLQVFQNNVNYMTGSNGDYTANGWAASHTTIAAPTITKNAFFGTSGCTAADTAPDGSCNTTEMSFPATTSATTSQSANQLLVTGLTALNTYTYYGWIKNSAAVSNAQTYISVQNGGTPNYNELSRTLVMAGSTWKRYSTTFTVPSGSTSVYVEVGTCIATGVFCVQGQLGASTIEAWVSGVTPGSAPGPYVPTTTTAATTIALDNIAATGDLAMALASSNAAVSITTQGAGNAVVGTMLDSNGTVLLGKSATDYVTTGLGTFCTGGTQTTSGLNTIYTFTSSGTLTCAGSFSAQILVVAGGGGASAAGGGAGGYCTTQGTPTCSLGASVTIPSGATTVTVGGGGAGAIVASAGTQGQSSSIGAIVTALGGGGGGAANANAPTGSLGSGGGAGPASLTTWTGGVGTQGNNGANSCVGTSNFPGGGGGGAGAVGTACTSDTAPGNGGNGAANSISGVSVTYAGGGGGGNAGASAFYGTGGTGGGGSTHSAGTANTGGGGGGGNNTNTGGAGGSGIAVISCLTSVCGGTLTSKAQGNFSSVERAYLAWNGSGGSINLNGTAIATDATARTTAGPFHIGTTGGTTAPCNCYITALAVYPTAVTPPLVASAPLTGVILGTPISLSSGTLQSGAPSTYVNGDSWNVTEDASNNTWSLCNDCGWGAISGTPAGNVILSEQTSWNAGTPGWFNLGNTSGGPPGLTNSFNANLGTFSTGTGGAGSGNTWKTCGIIAVKDGASNTDLLMGLAYDFYATAAPWVQTTSAGSIATVLAAGAATSSNWSGLAPNPPVLPITTPTFPTSQFSAPCFIQYGNGYVNSGLPTPNPDNSGAYLYAISPDTGWNYNSNIYLGRIALSTFMTSLGGTLSAAATPGSWTFYNSAGCAGGDGTNSACWGALASATPIITLANKLGRAQMTYLPTTNRYVLQTWFYPTMLGPSSGTQAQASMAASSEFEFIDFAKPWKVGAGVVSTVDYGLLGYYNPVIAPPSLALDGGYTATMIFAGNFDYPGNLSNNFTSTAIYTPWMAQATFRY